LGFAAGDGFAAGHLGIEAAGISPGGKKLFEGDRRGGVVRSNRLGTRGPAKK